MRWSCKSKQNAAGRGNVASAKSAQDKADAEAAP